MDSSLSVQGGRWDAEHPQGRAVGSVPLQRAKTDPF